MHICQVVLTSALLWSHMGLLFLQFHLDVFSTALLQVLVPGASPRSCSVCAHRCLLQRSTGLFAFYFAAAYLYTHPDLCFLYQWRVPCTLIPLPSAVSGDLGTWCLKVLPCRESFCLGCFLLCLKEMELRAFSIGLLLLLFLNPT